MLLSLAAAPAMAWHSAPASPLLDRIMQGVPVPPGPVVSFTEARPDGDGEAETPINGLETSGEALQACTAGLSVCTRTMIRAHGV
jgi:hypothetical protein